MIEERMPGFWPVKRERGFTGLRSEVGDHFG
jgi:hypothetical protein